MTKLALFTYIEENKFIHGHCICLLKDNMKQNVILAMLECNFSGEA